MEILRGLTAEYATLKAPLPRGEKGLRLGVDGKVDEESLKRESTQNGTALRPDGLVQITGIEFRDKEILFEINGGGKKKSKWYEHIEVGIGSGTHPVSSGQNAAPTGSSITLVFPRKLPNLTVEELKNHLGPVLDFNPTSPMQTLSRPIPPQFRKAIEEKRVEVGMDTEMVLVALGPPPRKIRETKEGVEQEDWIYGEPPQKVIFVTFEEEKVVDVHEYQGGVGGHTQPEAPAPPR